MKCHFFATRFTQRSNLPQSNSFATAQYFNDHLPILHVTEINFKQKDMTYRERNEPKNYLNYSFTVYLDIAYLSDTSGLLEPQL